MSTEKSAWTKKIQIQFSSMQWILIVFLLKARAWLRLLLPSKAYILVNCQMHEQGIRLPTSSSLHVLSPSLLFPFQYERGGSTMLAASFKKNFLLGNIFICIHIHIASQWFSKAICVCIQIFVSVYIFFQKWDNNGRIGLCECWVPHSSLLLNSSGISV